MQKKRTRVSTLHSSPSWNPPLVTTPVSLPLTYYMIRSSPKPQRRTPLSPGMLRTKRPLTPRIVVFVLRKMCKAGILHSRVIVQALRWIVGFTAQESKVNSTLHTFSGKTNGTQTPRSRRCSCNRYDVECASSDGCTGEKKRIVAACVYWYGTFSTSSSWLSRPALSENQPGVALTQHHTRIYVESVDSHRQQSGSCTLMHEFGLANKHLYMVFGCTSINQYTCGDDDGAASCLPSSVEASCCCCCCCCCCHT